MIFNFFYLAYLIVSWWFLRSGLDLIPYLIFFVFNNSNVELGWCISENTASTNLIANTYALVLLRHSLILSELEDQPVCKIMQCIGAAEIRDFPCQNDSPLQEWPVWSWTALSVQAVTQLWQNRELKHAMFLSHQKQLEVSCFPI